MYMYVHVCMYLCIFEWMFVCMYACRNDWKVAWEYVAKQIIERNWGFRSYSSDSDINNRSGALSFFVAPHSFFS